MDRTAVKSRDIAIVGYNAKTSILEIAFRSGGVYHYSGVSPETHCELMKAASTGIFFNENIKDKYACHKVQ